MNKTKSKIITSLSVGTISPLLYFLLINVSSVTYINKKGIKTEGASGLLGFIEFYGILESLIIYAKAVILGSILVFIICCIYDFISTKLNRKI